MARIAVVHHLSSSSLMGFGGAERVAIETVIGLREAGHEAYIVTYNPPGPRRLARLALESGIGPGEAADLFIRPRHMGSPDLVINTSGDALAGILMGFQPDIVYLHYPPFADIDEYYPGLHGAEKVVGKAYSLINRVLAHRVLLSSRIILANSLFTARLAMTRLRRRIHVLHPPVDTTGLHPPLPRERRGDYVLIVSRYSPEKNLEYAVVLARMIRDTGLDMDVVVAGSTGKYSRLVLRRLEKLVERLGGENIVFMKNLPRRSLVKLYREAYAYIHLTLREHFGISIVEAMAAGTPVIIPWGSGAWSDVAAGSTKYALPYRGLGEAVIHIARLRRDPALWERLSRNGLRRAGVFDKHVFRRRIALYAEEAFTRSPR